MSVWCMDEVKAGRAAKKGPAPGFQNHQALDDCNGGGNAAAARKYLTKVMPKDRVKQELDFVLAGTQMQLSRIELPIHQSSGHTFAV